MTVSSQYNSTALVYKHWLVTFKKQIPLICRFCVVCLYYGSHIDFMKAVFMYLNCRPHRMTEHHHSQMYIVIQAVVLPVGQQMRPDAVKLDLSGSVWRMIYKIKRDYESIKRKQLN